MVRCGLIDKLGLTQRMSLRALISLTQERTGLSVEIKDWARCVILNRCTNGGTIESILVRLLHVMPTGIIGVRFKLK